MKAARVCTIAGCDEIARARGLCNRHYLHAWEVGDLPPAPKRECLVCGQPFTPTYGSQVCGGDCDRVRSSMRAGRRKKHRGEWEVFRRENQAQGFARNLHRSGYRRVHKRTPSAQLTYPHFSCWRVGELYVVRHDDPGGA